MKLPFYSSLVLAFAIYVIVSTPMTQRTSTIDDARRAFLQVELESSEQASDRPVALEKLKASLEELGSTDQRTGKTLLWLFMIGTVLCGALISQAMTIRTLRRRKPETE